MNNAKFEKLTPRAPRATELARELARLTEVSVYTKGLRIFDDPPANEMPRRSAVPQRLLNEVFESGREVAIAKREAELESLTAIEPEEAEAI